MIFHNISSILAALFIHQQNTSIQSDMKKITKFILLTSLLPLPLWISCNDPEDEETSLESNEEQEQTPSESDNKQEEPSQGNGNDPQDPFSDNNDNNQEEPSVDTLNVEISEWHNSCNFDAYYSPYSVNNSYSDNIHKEGDHAFCSINDTLYEVEFKSPGDKLSHFKGSFHVLKKNGEEVKHEDEEVWYEQSHIWLYLESHSRYDTIIKNPLYYRDKGYYLSQEVIQNIVAAVDSAYVLDSIAEANGEGPRPFGNRFIPPYIQQERIGSYWHFYYSKEEGYYWQLSGSWSIKDCEGLKKTSFDPQSELFLP